MAFEKKVWLGGDTVTAAHLNRIENGIVEAMGSGGSGSGEAVQPDENGNGVLAGSLTLGKGTADEVTVTAAQLKQLIAMLSA